MLVKTFIISYEKNTISVYSMIYDLKKTMFFLQKIKTLYAEYHHWL